jgi:hypothetical protein
MPKNIKERENDEKIPIWFSMISPFIGWKAQSDIKHSFLPLELLILPCFEFLFIVDYVNVL